MLTTLYCCLCTVHGKQCNPKSWHGGNVFVSAKAEVNVAVGSTGTLSMGYVPWHLELRRHTKVHTELHLNDVSKYVMSLFEIGR